MSSVSLSLLQETYSWSSHSAEAVEHDTVHWGRIAQILQQPESLHKLSQQLSDYPQDSAAQHRDTTKIPRFFIAPRSTAGKQDVEVKLFLKREASWLFFEEAWVRGLNLSCSLIIKKQPVNRFPSLKHSLYHFRPPTALIILLQLLVLLFKQ